MPPNRTPTIPMRPISAEDVAAPFTGRFARLSKPHVQLVMASAPLPRILFRITCGPIGALFFAIAGAGASAELECRRAKPDSGNAIINPGAAHSHSVEQH